MEANATKRVVVPALEDILYKEYKALDKGFVRLVDYMGSDESIVQAARISYGRGTKSVNQDGALINYLMRHSHTTPFEMCEIKFHIKLPIFVARQWIRHRTANVNEYSARYSVLDHDFYIPEHDQIAKQSEDNAQGRGSSLSDNDARYVTDLMIRDSNMVYDTYNKFLNKGVSREISRINLTLNYYTEYYWKIDLHNLLHFLKLRSETNAQYEIRVYAKIILDIVKKWVPLAYAAFVEYCLESRNFSKSALDIVKKLIAGEKVIRENSAIGKREWKELMNVLELE